MYRDEHPNPQFLRNEWINLNGEWDFEFDFGRSGCERAVYEKTKLDKKITVPFCPESKLSGIEYKDFINGVWYLREFSVPAEWNSGKVWICFGAVDYLCRVYINGSLAGEHRGGYTSFRFDITKLLKSGKNTVSVYAEDDNRSGLQPRGKQADKYYSSRCDYTRTTGIWQTVWLEHTPDKYIENIKFYPDPENQKLTFAANVSGTGNLSVRTMYGGKDTGMCKLTCTQNTVYGEIPLSEKHLWEPGVGRLYDVEIRFNDDVVKSYFGLRDISIDGNKININGKTVFQRLVLDQGFYPDGIYTAPTEDDLINDIILSLNAGFNGARLHQKVFEPRYLYHCDRLGYIVWGEYGNWGFDHSDPKTLEIYLNEWHEAVERDFNHPSIVVWCPFNETWDYEGRKQSDAVISTVYNMTKSWDSTRPCVDTSGNFHTETDIYDIHDYEQDVKVFDAHYKNFDSGEVFNGSGTNGRQSYNDKRYFGKPYIVSEYGGICLNTDSLANGWGYGNESKSTTEFVERYKSLTTTLLENANISGFCYTQLYDVEQETNGLYTYSRVPKVDMEIIKKINTQKAKIE